MPNVFYRSADCIIVGGGIGGAVLALILGQEGRNVIILEKEAKRAFPGRPEILMNYTLESLRPLGIAEHLMKEAALPLSSLEILTKKNSRLFRLSQEDFRNNYVQPYSVDPGMVRHLLIETAESTQKVEILYSVEVKGLVSEKDKVIGVYAKQAGHETQFHAPLVVGDDGAHSRVRKALGIPIELEGFPLDFLAASGPEIPGAEPGEGQAWFNPAAGFDGIFGIFFLPQAGKRTALVIPGTSACLRKLLKSPAMHFYERLSSISPRFENMKGFRFPEDFTLFKRPFGHATRYVSNGAAILGDAAHPVTPAGGQGANMAVADAISLARVALDCFRYNDFSVSRLAGYEIDRRPANIRSLEFSHRAKKIITTLRVFPPLGFLFPFILRQLDKSPERKNTFIRALSLSFHSRKLV